MAKRDRSDPQARIDRELISKGRKALNDFSKHGELTVPARKPDSKLISIRLPLEMMSALRAVALRKGDIGYQRLIKRYINEGLGLEKKRLSDGASLRGPQESYFQVAPQASSATAASAIAWQAGK